MNMHGEMKELDRFTVTEITKDHILVSVSGIPTPIRFRKHYEDVMIGDVGNIVEWYLPISRMTIPFLSFDKHPKNCRSCGGLGFYKETAEICRFCGGKGEVFKWL